MDLSGLEAFYRDVLGEPLWWGQIQILEAIIAKPWISVASFGRWPTRRSVTSVTDSAPQP